MINNDLIYGAFEETIKKKTFNKPINSGLDDETNSRNSEDIILRNLNTTCNLAFFAKSSKNSYVNVTISVIVALKEA